MQNEFVDFAKLERLHLEARVARDTQISSTQALARAILPILTFLETRIRALSGLEDVQMRLPISRAEQRLLIVKAVARGFTQRGMVAARVVHFLRQDLL